MTEVVIVLLEVINIEHDQAERLVFCFAGLGLFVQGVNEITVVVNTCEAVEPCLFLYERVVIGIVEGERGTLRDGG